MGLVLGAFDMPLMRSNGYNTRMHGARICLTCIESVEEMLENKMLEAGVEPLPWHTNDLHTHTHTHTCHWGGCFIRL